MRADYEYQLSQRDSICKVYKISYKYDNFTQFQVFKFIPDKQLSKLRSSQKLTDQQQYQSIQKQIQIYRILAKPQQRQKYTHLPEIYQVRSDQTFKGQKGTLIRMKYYSLGTLKNYIKKLNPNAVNCPEMALDVLCQMMCALSELYSLGIRMHRDIKLQNIVIDSNGLQKQTLILIDYGTCSSKQQSKIKIGTQLYMSSQVYNGIDYTSKCDMQSLGIVLYNTMNGLIFEHLPQIYYQFPFDQNILHKLDNCKQYQNIRIIQQYFKKREDYYMRKQKDSVIFLSIKKTNDHNQINQQIHQWIRKQIIVKVFQREQSRLSLKVAFQKLLQKQNFFENRRHNLYKQLQQKIKYIQNI